MSIVVLQILEYSSNSNSRVLLKLQENFKVKCISNIRNSLQIDERHWNWQIFFSLTKILQIDKKTWEIDRNLSNPAKFCKLPELCNFDKTCSNGPKYLKYTTILQNWEICEIDQNFSNFLKFFKFMQKFIKFSNNNKMHQISTNIWISNKSTIMVQSHYQYLGPTYMIY